MIISKLEKSGFDLLVDQAKKAGKKLVPVWLEITEDMLTPVVAYLTLRRPGVPAFLYESVVGGERTSRWSFLGFNPFRILTYLRQQVGISERDSGEFWEPKGDPRQILADQLAEFSSLSVPILPPFTGGLVGSVGYDAVRLVEPTVPDSTEDDLGLPDITLMYFDTIIAFDHVFKKIYLISLVPITGDTGISYRGAIRHLEEIHQQLLRPRLLDLVPGTAANGVSSNMDQAQFEEMVKRSKDHITAGDIFQVVLSQRFSCPLTVEPFDIYRCLRHLNPSPYLFFLDFGTWQLIGSSPEILVNVKDRQVTISPIAGTRPRGDTEEEDARLEAELLADPKEQAEHIMLVDLARNDVGRVAEFGSVRIPPGRYMYTVRYSTVMHIVTDVIGKLRQGLNPLQALWASLPAGTLSGAPKVRAMQVIDELEPTRRGPYGGTVGFIGFDNNIETAIVIRTAVVNRGTVHWQAGAGIVADSDPKTEFLESCHKAGSIRRALEMAGNTVAEEVRA